jgi:hypothetical protein
MIEIWTGFIIGLLGSFHCIGMCGPIALALPENKKSKLQHMIGRLLYNLGRTLTYALFGLLFGLLGERLALVGLQQYLSIGLGSFILIYIFLPKKLKANFASTKPYQFISGSIKSAFSKLTKSGSPSSLFTFGIINGFLPCGFVYVAVAGAVSTGSVLNGFLFMLLFGLGTTPIMLAASMAGQFLNMKIKRKINRLIPVFAVVLAVIFILRGLNLGIPYLSPKLIKDDAKKEVICH